MIGVKGRTKAFEQTNEAEMRRYVRQCLKKREKTPKRIGVGYKVAEFVIGELH
jgi:hypothetical protein